MFKQFVFQAYVSGAAPMLDLYSLERRPMQVYSKQMIVSRTPSFILKQVILASQHFVVIRLGQHLFYELQCRP